ncbi:MAG: NERD domain-containing protein [Gammaproteobacteria bacterium]|nr:NERD domain-containing protein [Gammaproteobacteria bacterium]
MFKNYLLDLKTRRVLNRLGLVQRRNLRCPDGMDGYYDIERLVLTASGVSLVQTVRYAGLIFCAEDIDEWTQMIDGKSYRFANPLVELSHCINTVRVKLPRVPVDGYLLFDHRATFPRGKPANVIQIDSIPAILQRDMRTRPDPGWLTALETLV